jgi:hypothetical protein
MVGTPVAAAARWFEKRYGRAAVADVCVKLAPEWRGLVDPHAEAFGMLGARWYPYAFLENFIVTARAVVHAEEDPFIRDIAFAGIDGSMSTGMRAMARWFKSPKDFADASRESWRLFHDTGVMSVPSLEPKSVRRRVTDWQGHNVTVCKLVGYVFERSFSKTGVRSVQVRREECVSWGRVACTFHISWE